MISNGTESERQMTIIPGSLKNKRLLYTAGGKKHGYAVTSAKDFGRSTEVVARDLWERTVP